jgi:hypothetical protein
VARGREEFCNESTWTLYWHGDLIEIGLTGLGTSGPRGGEISGRDRLRRIVIPAHLQEKRSEILADLIEALTAYKDGGVFATATSYTYTLDI